MALDPALLPDNVDALRRLIAGMAREAVQADTLIEKLRGDLARLKRARFGASSEKLGGRVEQLELAIEALEVDEAERLADASIRSPPDRPISNAAPQMTERVAASAWIDRRWRRSIRKPPRQRGRARAGAASRALRQRSWG